MLAPLEREDKNDVSICIMQAYLKALKFRSYIHNLNLTEHACSKGLTRHVFHFTRMQACVCARKIDDVKPTVQSSRVCTRHVQFADAHVHVRNAHAKFGLRVHANCKPRTAE